MAPDELQKLPGGSEPIPSNGSWGGSEINYYPSGFVHPGVGNPEYIPRRDVAYLFAFSIVFMVFTSLVVIVRIFSRVALRTIGVDDWLIIAATLATIGVTTTICLAVVEGAGMHWYDIPYAENNMLESLIMPIHGGIYATSVLLIKLSILFFLRRLFENTSNLMSRLIMGYIITNIVFFIISVFCLTFISASFSLLYSLGGIHLFLEIAILILPVRMIWRLNLSLGQKIVALFILGLGGIVCVISVLRLQFFSTWIKEYDTAFNSPYIYLYDILECTLGILASSAPSMKAAYIHCIKPAIRSLRIWTSKGLAERLEPTSEDSRDDGYSHNQTIRSERVYSDDEEAGNSYQQLVKMHTPIELGYWRGIHAIEDGRSTE